MSVTVEVWACNVCSALSLSLLLSPLSASRRLCRKHPSLMVPCSFLLNTLRSFSTTLSGCSFDGLLIKILSTSENYKFKEREHFAPNIDGCKRRFLKQDPSWVRQLMDIMPYLNLNDQYHPYHLAFDFIARLWVFHWFVGIMFGAQHADCLREWNTKQSRLLSTRGSVVY